MNLEGLLQGFSTLALLTFRTRFFFVCYSTVLCVVHHHSWHLPTRCQWVDASNATAVTIKNVSDLTKCPLAGKTVPS